MKIDLKQVLKDKEGKAFGKKISCLVVDKETNEFVKKDGGGLFLATYDNKELDATLKDSLIDAMINEPQKQGETLSKTKKRDRYRIYKMLIEANGSIDLESEDITTLKDALWNQESTLVAGQCCDMLENQKGK